MADTEERVVSPDEAVPVPTSDAVPSLEHPLVLFDGVCHLCNRSVQFILDRDPRGVFRFAPLQSALGRRLLHAHGFADGWYDGIVLIEKGRCWVKSTAALRIAGRLPFPWKLLVVLRLVPRVVRDAVYDIIARYRYRWFGRGETCRLPTPELRDRFY